jgi:hypothetical protein
MAYLYPRVLRRKIIECQMNGMSAKETATWLGMSVKTLNFRRRQLGLPRFELPLYRARPRREGDYTPDDDALIRCCLDAGCAIEQIAALLGRSAISIYQKRLRLGYPPIQYRDPARTQRGPCMRKRIWQGERLDRLRELKSAGLPPAAIAVHLGVTTNTIVGAIYRHLKPQEARP